LCSFVNYILTLSFNTTLLLAACNQTSYNNIIGLKLPNNLINYMHVRYTLFFRYSRSGRRETDFGTSVDGKKRKKSSGVNAQDDTDAKDESDSPTANVDEPAATEETFSSAPPPKKKQSSRVNTQDDYDATGKGGSTTATVRPSSTDDTSSGSIAW
jgi:hypothetical protein